MNCSEPPLNERLPVEVEGSKTSSPTRQTSRRAKTQPSRQSIYSTPLPSSRSRSDALAKTSAAAREIPASHEILPRDQRVATGLQCGFRLRRLVLSTTPSQTSVRDFRPQSCGIPQRRPCTKRPCPCTRDIAGTYRIPSYKRDKCRRRPWRMPQYRAN
jgi:hypothetical protein